LVDEGVEDASLPVAESRVSLDGPSESNRVRAEGELTVHAKGMLFKFVSTKKARRMRLVRPGPVRKAFSHARQSTKRARCPRYATAAALAGMKTGKTSESVPTAMVGGQSWWCGPGLPIFAIAMSGGGLSRPGAEGSKE
jgi:hypothetical protein